MPAGIFWLRLRLAYGLPAALGVAQEQAAFECRKRLSRRIEADWPRNQHARFAFAFAFAFAFPVAPHLVRPEYRPTGSVAQSLQAVPFA
jgi:hypothetical protein